MLPMTTTAKEFHAQVMSVNDYKAALLANADAMHETTTVTMAEFFAKSDSIWREATRAGVRSAVADAIRTEMQLTKCERTYNNAHWALLRKAA